MSLIKAISTRNIRYKGESKKILDSLTNKLNAVVYKLLNDNNLKVLWTYIDILENNIIEIHGFMESKIGELLYNDEINEYVKITEENSKFYNKKIVILVGINVIEFGSVEDIVNQIKELNTSDINTNDITYSNKIKH